MNHQRFCAWSGIIFLVLFVAGWGFVAGFFPLPPGPLLTPEEVAAFFLGGATRIRAGLIVAMTAAIFWVPFVAGISEQMSRIQGVDPVLVRTQSLGGTAGFCIFMMTIMVWLTATFRDDLDPKIIRLLNDFGWLTFLVTFAPFVAQLVALALAILGDPSPEPVFPRWWAYFTIWAAISFVPAALVVYLKHGPFAWTGLVGFYLPLTLFVSWIGGTSWLSLQAIAAREAAKR